MISATEHFKKICSVCGNIISQCRCPAPDKPIIYGICEACEKKSKDLDPNGVEQRPIAPKEN